MDDKKKLKPVISNSLWDNDMVKNALKALTPEDLERYEKIGQSMYKDIDFETTELNDPDNKYPPFIRDCIGYIYESLKSGLHPSDLSKEEVKILQNFDGDKWYEKWGYLEEDLTDFVTIKKD